MWESLQNPSQSWFIAHFTNTHSDERAKNNCCEQVPDITIQNILPQLNRRQRQKAVASDCFFKGLPEQGYKLESAVKGLSHTVLPNCGLQEGYNLSLQQLKNFHEDNLPGPVPLSLAWLSPSSSSFQPHWATSSSHWSFCWFQIEGGVEALAVLSSKYHNSREGKQIWNTTRNWNTTVILHKFLGEKNKSTRFRFVSRSCDKQVALNFICKCIFNQMKIHFEENFWRKKRTSEEQPKANYSEVNTL